MRRINIRNLKRRTKVLLIVLAVVMAVAIWASCFEPLLLTVSEIEFTDERLPQALDGTRIVYISDVHVGPGYSPANVRRMADKIAGLHPDMVLFGGDLLEHEDSALGLHRAQVASIFAALQPPLGKYAVYGNHDIWTPTMKAIAGEILADGGFTILENSAVEITPGFYVAGTAPWPMGGENDPGNHADVGQVTWTTEGGAFSLLLSHEPAQIRKNAQYPFALQLSGHTHGGQVALPIVGPLRLPGGLELYRAGFYRYEGLRMYVSRGVGTSVLRARFLTPPEIVVVTLRRK